MLNNFSFPVSCDRDAIDASLWILHNWMIIIVKGTQKGKNFYCDIKICDIKLIWSLVFLWNIYKYKKPSLMLNIEPGGQDQSRTRIIHSFDHAEDDCKGVWKYVMEKMFQMLIVLSKILTNIRKTGGNCSHRDRSLSVTNSQLNTYLEKPADTKQCAHVPWSDNRIFKLNVLA